jgi:malate/lactate dehydrogenase
MTVTYQIDEAKRRIHTRCIGAVTLDEVQQHYVARVRPRVQFDGCAIIASRDALFGMARMFEVFAESYFGPNREVPTCSSCS